MTEAKQPNFLTFQTKLDDYYILGISHKENNPAMLGEFWGEFDSSKNQVLREVIEKHSKPGNRLLGLMYPVNPPEEGYWNYITGGIIEGIEVAPEGADLVKFPASEFFVVTHDWVNTSGEADSFIGFTVGHAHSNEAQAQIPDGYERFNDIVVFIERYNYNFDENKFRTEIWFAIRKTNDNM